MSKFKEPRRRNWVKKSHFDYEAPEERLQDEQERLKVDFVFTVLDGAIAHVKERFTQLMQHNELFGFLIISSRSTSSIRVSSSINAELLKASLQHGKQKVIYAAELFDELKALCLKLPTA